MNNQKLTEEQFLSQMRELLRNAPKETVMIINVMSDPKKTSGECIIAAQGNSMDLIYCLNRAFKESRDFEKILSDAVGFRNHYNSCSSTNSGDGLKSVLDEVLKNNRSSFLDHFKEMLTNIDRKRS